MAFTIKNKDGKNVLFINNKGEVALARFVSLTKDEKTMLANLFCKLTGKSYDEAQRFLDFNDTERFCS